MLLQAQHIAKAFGARTLFSGVDFLVNEGDRMALIGANGMGKTTLFEILAGRLTPDEGRVAKTKGLTMSYLTQSEIEQFSHASLLEEVLSGAQPLLDLKAEIDGLASQMADADQELAQAAADRYAKLTGKFEHADGYNLEPKAKKILFGLGFHEADLDRPPNQFSGGWRVRAGLAKLLFETPDLLLLDEPTNHLDLESVKWLEGYLQDWQGAVLVISHDRAFLDHVVNNVLYLADQQVQRFAGNYAKFKRELADLNERKLKAYTAQQAEIKRAQEFIEKFRYKATKARQVQDRVKKLEKIERLKPPHGTKSVHFEFVQPPRSSDAVAKLKNVTKSYGKKAVYDEEHELTFNLYRGDKIALVGPNGAGKSTLLKMLAGVERPSGGKIKLGEHVDIAYYAQHQLDELDARNTVYQEIESVTPGWTRTQVMSLGGAFLFSEDDFDKKVSVLSGGEKARLALAKMLARPACLLCLDEPTNHLDIEAIDVLTAALQKFSGTIVLISHDEQLINDVATKVIEVKDGQATVFKGDYAYYRRKTELDLADQSLDTAVDAVAAALGGADGGSAGQTKKKTKAQKRAEAEARNAAYSAVKGERARLEEVDAWFAEKRPRLKELEAQLASQELYQDPDRFQDVLQEYNELKKQMEQNEDEWLSLGATIEAALK
ncbi:MAG: ABC-F family ATP-binding cassette domain-containing protein [Coriobacteriales bacterium]|jgi:ATP-binding cassette subfamily F protein 3|nr:ABC-F family ATP-binding cassette domain-containing protein [Coriobacteriales bacterium]